MDAGFLDHIRHRRNLIGLFHEYGVRYYVATNPAQWNGCYRVDEPQLAGPASPHMTGYFCVEPVMKIYYPGATTMIFEVVL